MAITSLKHKKPHVPGLSDPIAPGTNLGVGEDTSRVGLTGVSDLAENNAQAQETQLTSALSGGGGRPSPSGPSTGQSGAATGKPVTVNRAPTTRMGVGPGGPPLGYNEAYSLLNAPESVGDIQQAGRTFSNISGQQRSAFDEAAGPPQAFGERERRAIDAGATPGAPQTGLDEARDVLFRRYGGPMAMAQGRETERGRTEATKQGQFGEDIKTVAAAFGEQSGRATMAELSGETPGMGTATAQSAYESGESLAAQKLAAEQGGQNALYAEQLRQSMDYGQKQVEGARGIREAAGEYLGGKEEGLWQGIGLRADAQRQEQSDGQAALASFRRTGDLEDIRGKVEGSVLSGKHTAREAMQIWDERWDHWTEQARERHGSWMANLVKEIKPMVSTLHYTGNSMLLFTREDMDRLSNMAEFSRIRGSIRKMWLGDRTRRDPGNWLSDIMGYAEEQTDRGEQARKFLDLTRIVFSRQTDPVHGLEGPFAMAMPHNIRPGEFGNYRNAGTSLGGGIVTPDQIAAGAQTEGPAYWKDQLRSIAGNTTGYLSHFRNLYGREGNEFSPDIAGNLRASEGVINDYTAMTEREQDELNQMYHLRGGEQDFYQRQEGPESFGIRVDEGFQPRWDRWEQAGQERVAEDETNFLSQREARRRFFLATLRDAEAAREGFDIGGTRSRDIKLRPALVPGQEDRIPAGYEDWGLTEPVLPPEEAVV